MKNGGTLAAAFIAGLLLTAISPMAHAQSGIEGSESAGAVSNQDDTGSSPGDRARIEALEKRIQALEALVEASGIGVPLSPEEAGAVRGRGAFTPRLQYENGNVTFARQDTAEPEGLSAQAAGTRKTPAPSESVEAVTKREQGYFGDRLSFELGATYSHFDDARLNLSGFLALDAIFLGRISLDEATSDVLVADLTARYGVTDRLQFDVNVPYLIRRSNFQSGGAGGNAAGLAEATLWGDGIGDINFGASYRLLRETPGRPDVVLNARVKAPTGRHPWGVELIEVPDTEGNLSIPETLSTGSGVWSASAGVSVLKTLDPMIVFGSFTYFHNFSRHFSDIDDALGDQPGTVKVGGAFQYGAGVAYALNDRSSLSLSFTQRFVRRTQLRRDGEDAFRNVVGSQANVGILNIGANFALADKVSIITTVGVGMTTDAPDMMVSVRVPFSF
jgi:hypothetical protein